jgi:hypothetical protein
VGQNWGSIAESYSTDVVSGGWAVGGFVGKNYGTIASNYSSGSVRGDSSVGGLAGSTGDFIFGTGSSMATSSFWKGLIDDVRIYDRAVKP